MSLAGHGSKRPKVQRGGQGERREKGIKASGSVSERRGGGEEEVAEEEEGDTRGDEHHMRWILLFGSNDSRGG